MDIKNIYIALEAKLKEVEDEHTARHPNGCFETCTANKELSIEYFLIEKEYYERRLLNEERDSNLWKMCNENLSVNSEYLKRCAKNETTRNV